MNCGWCDRPVAEDEGFWFKGWYYPGDEPCSWMPNGWNWKEPVKVDRVEFHEKCWTQYAKHYHNEVRASTKHGWRVYGP